MAISISESLFNQKHYLKREYAHLEFVTYADIVTNAPNRAKLS